MNRCDECYYRGLSEIEKPCIDCITKDNTKSMFLHKDVSHNPFKDEKTDV